VRRPAASRSISRRGGSAQEILSLYDFSDRSRGRAPVGRHETNHRRHPVRPHAPRRRLNGRADIERLSARRRYVTVEFDEQKYVAPRVPFACVLERFLGLYVSINSFTRMVARTRQRGRRQAMAAARREQTLV
jgi:type VI secretion system protein ImpG